MLRRPHAPLDANPQVEDRKGMQLIVLAIKVALDAPTPVT
jgi:hypothetical protein